MEMCAEFKNPDGIEINDRVVIELPVIGYIGVCKVIGYNVTSGYFFLKSRFPIGPLIVHGRFLSKVSDTTIVEILEAR